MKAAEAASTITAHRREKGERVIGFSPPFILLPGLGERRGLAGWRCNGFWIVALSKLEVVVLKWECQLSTAHRPALGAHTAIPASSWPAPSGRDPPGVGSRTLSCPGSPAAS